MTMYDDLIKAIRQNTCHFDACGMCPKRNALCLDRIALQAADAIEELSKLADAIPHVCECCIGCEMEKKNGGCDNAFVLSPKRAMQYLIKPRWIPVTERLPSDFVSVQAHMTDAGNFPPVREAYVVNKNWFFPALKEFHPVDMWKRFDEPPKEE